MIDWKFSVEKAEDYMRKYRSKVQKYLRLAKKYFYRCEVEFHLYCIHTNNDGFLCEFTTETVHKKIRNIELSDGEEGEGEGEEEDPNEGWVDAAEFEPGARYHQESESQMEVEAGVGDGDEEFVYPDYRNDSSPQVFGFLENYLEENRGQELGGEMFEGPQNAEELSNHILGSQQSPDKYHHHHPTRPGDEPPKPNHSPAENPLLPETNSNFVNPTTTNDPGVDYD